MSVDLTTLPSVSQVLESLEYKGGSLFWRTDRPKTHFRTERGWKIFNKMYAGKEAGSPHFIKDRGYYRWTVDIFKRKILRSNLVWAIHHGEWPILDVDHADRNTLNDEITNLRLATACQSQWNTGVREDKIGGLKGAYLDSSCNRWMALITANGKQSYLGHYDTPEEAHAAYCAAAIKHHGKFACFG